MKYVLTPLFVLALLGLAARADDDPEPRPVIVKTKEGLRYEVHKRGTGAEAKTGLTIEYRRAVWVATGTKKGKKIIGDPTKDATTVLGNGEYIRGIELGLTGMKVGGKRRLYIPTELAFGADGWMDVVPPNSDLIVEVELLKVTEAAAEPIEKK